MPKPGWHIAIAAGLLAIVAPAPALARDRADASRSGPNLSASKKRLAAALHCPSKFTHDRRQPVLLVHGTGTDSDLSWSWNYERALPAAGFDTCAVDLPKRSYGDIQVAAEYVVYAVRRIYKRSGREVDVIGHSQGPMEARWAIRWWPDVRAHMDDLVGLSAPNHGIDTAACDDGECAAAVWQLGSKSRFLAGLGSGDDTPGSVDQTSVISKSDGVVTPMSTSRLMGATNVVVQNLCPERQVDHVQMLYDAAVYAIALDALTHSGRAKPKRIDRAACRRARMPNTLTSGRDRLLTSFAFNLLGNQGELVHAEPRLKPYAR